MEEIIPVEYVKSKYENAIVNLTQRDSPNVVVLFCKPSVYNQLFSEMLKHSEMLKRSEKMQFVSSEAVTYVNLKDYGRITAEMIFVAPMFKPIREFENYILNLNTVNTKWKTWFNDFYGQVMNCSFNANKSLLQSNACNSSKTLQLSKQTILSNPFVNAVYAFAHALHEILKKHCPNSSLNCKPLREVSGKLLLYTLRNVSFKSLSGQHVHFNKNGRDLDGAKYTINYLPSGTRDGFNPIKIGQWHGRLQINSTLLWLRNFSYVKSYCSEICGAHQIQLGIPGKSFCCWSCHDCHSHTVAINNTHCQTCNKGFIPDLYLDTCIKIQPIYYTVDGSVPLVLIIPPLMMSTLGIFAIAFILFVFIRYNNTALVKASARELSYLLLVGLFLSYVFPFVSILKPTPAKCFSQFILDSFPMTISYTAIAVKTNRVFRIFDDSRFNITPLPFARPLSQIFLSIGLICFQVILLTVLMVFGFPREKLIDFSSTEVFLVCATSDTQIFLSHINNVILLIACTYYSYKTRNIPKKFNESKYIAFAMYGSCVMIVAFLVVYAVMANAGFAEIYKLAVHCYRVTLTTTVVLTCFFAPKIYVILSKPEENVSRPTLNFPDSGGISMEETQNEIVEYR